MRFIDYIYILFLIIATFDPTGNYTSYSKYVLFTILILCGIITYFKKPKKISYTNKLILISFTFLPLIGVFIALVKDKLIDVGYARNHIFGMLFVYLFFYLITADIKKILKIFWFNGLLLASVSLFLIALAYFFDFNLVYLFVIDNDNINMAVERSFLGYEISGVYFRTGPFIMFAFVYHLYKYHGHCKLLLSIILYLSLALCGSRTPALLQTLILLIYLYDSKFLNKYILRFIAILGIISVCYLTYNLIGEKDENSNEIKYANFNSYIYDINANNSYLIGNGVGSTFYAKGNGEYLAFSELSYLDILRMYGIPIGLYFSLLFFRPIFDCKKYFKKYFFLARVMYTYFFFLLLAGTNPILLGSIGMTALTLIMAISNNVKTKNENELLFYKQ